MPYKLIPPLGANASGEPAAPPISYDDAARLAKLEREGPGAGDPKGLWGLMTELFKRLKVKTLGDVGELPREKLRDPADPDVGWGVCYHQTVPPEVRQEVERLRQHRKGRLLPDWRGYHDLGGWLDDQGINLLNKDTDDLPYYILLVGPPEDIAFEDQYGLDRIRSVGRLDLGNDAAAYRTYVDGVVASEKNEREVARRAVFAAARAEGDEATRLSAEHLVPALKDLPELAAGGWAVRHLDAAGRDALTAELKPDGGGRAPALAFVATHGLAFNSGDKRQVDEQGAWISSDWQGGPVPAAACLGAGDVGAGFHLPGSVVFSLACFGAGASAESEYAGVYNRLYPAKPLPEAIAPKPFSAALPRRLLSYRQGGKAAGALAYVGHVGLSWASAFWDAESQEADPAIFAALVRRLVEGDTVGMAANRFADIVNDYNAALAGHVNNLGKLDIGDKKTVGNYWIGRNNARGFIVLGDPAVRIDSEKLIE